MLVKHSIGEAINLFTFSLLCKKTENKKKQSLFLTLFHILRNTISTTFTNIFFLEVTNTHIHSM